MKLSIEEKKILYAFGCRNHENTVRRLKWVTALTVDEKVKRLAQLELAPAPIRTGYYLTQAPQVRQLRSPPASPEILKKERGILD